MDDFLVLAVSFLFIFAFIGAATLLLRRGILGPAATRKVVHIGVAHWWLLYLAFIHSALVGMIGAVAFIIINTISYKLRIFKAMEDPRPTRNLGTIWFPLALSLLIGLEMLSLLTRWQAGIGVLIMGWGDGMAALVGQHFTKKYGSIFGSKKSVAGTAALFLFSFTVTAVMTRIFVPGLGIGELLLRAVATAMFAALVELLTPFGLDNITLPVSTALFYVYAASAPIAGPFVAAIGLNAIVACGAYRKRALDEGGAVVGTAVGGFILVSGGLSAFAILAGFFLSSTAIGRITEARRKPDLIGEKGSRRDALQVLANAGGGTVAVFLYALTRNPMWLAAFATSFAAANADTWASEIGVLYRKLPRSILTWKELPTGASGGVTTLGFLASAAGAAFIGLLFAASYAGLSDVRMDWGLVVLIATLGGLLGSIVDSVLGAALQAQYTCVVTGAYTERSHTDGLPNILVKGLRWFTNDAVNFASTAMVTVLAALVYALIRQG